jgi:hypothetical protein
MPTNIDDEIRHKTEAFAKDLTVLVRRAALEAATAALSGATVAAHAAPTAAKRGRGRPRKVAVAAPAAVPAAKAVRGRPAAKAHKAAPAAKAPVSKKTQRASGEKRPPAELAKLTDKLGDYIKSNPGRRMEAIGKALGLPTRELNLPIKKLLAAKRVKTQGHKRATEYFPA